VRIVKGQLTTFGIEDTRETVKVYTCASYYAGGHEDKREIHSYDWKMAGSGRVAAAGGACTDSDHVEVALSVGHIEGFGRSGCSHLYTSSSFYSV